LTTSTESTPSGDLEDIGHRHDSVLVAAYRAATVRQASVQRDVPTVYQQLRSRNVSSGDLRQYLCRRYEQLSQGDLPESAFDFRLTRKLGEGGQGVVRLTECRGSDGFQNGHLALKMFSPHLYPSVQLYEADMHRMGRVASIIAGIDQGNILNVQRFEAFDGVRLMLMKHVEGYDLRRLMNPWSVNRVREARPDLLNEICNSLVSLGPVQTRFLPGAAIAIARGCLAALGRLHSSGVVYGDVKPSNIMLTPHGEVKIVDIGSAFEAATTRHPFFCTPEYVAPEVLENGECTPRSDLASLGYVLIEMLLGRPLFSSSSGRTVTELSVPQEATTGIATRPDPRLIDEKRSLPDRLQELLPSYSTTLIRFLGKLIAPCPADRFPNAGEADVDQQCGAYLYFQELVRCGLDMQFENEFRVWFEALGPNQH
jgi:eukaryotic-like serine/threonine-protein kinase